MQDRYREYRIIQFYNILNYTHTRITQYSNLLGSTKGSSRIHKESNGTHQDIHQDPPKDPPGSTNTYIYHRISSGSMSVSTKWFVLIDRRFHKWIYLGSPKGSNGINEGIIQVIPGVHRDMPIWHCKMIHQDLSGSTNISIGIRNKILSSNWFKQIRIGKYYG